jgi:hypothetical protein
MKLFVDILRGSVLPQMTKCIFVATQPLTHSTCSVIGNHASSKRSPAVQGFSEMCDPFGMSVQRRPKIHLDLPLGLTPYSGLEC